jgi:hypothetical protein
MKWKFDVSGMTPDQLRMIVGAIDDKLDYMRGSQFGYKLADFEFLRDVAQRLRAGLPDSRAFPEGTVL